ncbi:3'-5' exonuclease domain-containing protein [Mycena kentingensis (nom. inval.)]|nr:3'-5' exonuclease domain-containing protein [Mycena kentingensis (nom. inval.)]
MVDILHTTPESVQLVVHALVRSGSGTIFFDCEGRDLGDQGGALILLSFGTPSDDDVHLVHVPLVGLPALRPLFNILESPVIEKIVFDGRMDQSALYHECGCVVLRNVVDIQIADIRARRQRGERNASNFQLSQIRRYLPDDNFAAHRSMYRDVHRLSGLAGLFKERKLEGKDLGGIKEKFARKLDWEEQPLTDDHITYAANDIRLLKKLHAHFVARCYITDQVRRESAEYISLWISSGQPADSDPYRHHGLLPLGIVDAKGGKKNILCGGCTRKLGRDSFPKKSAEQGAKCFVCRAVDVRAEREAERERKNLKEEE